MYVSKLWTKKKNVRERNIILWIAVRDVLDCRESAEQETKISKTNQHVYERRNNEKEQTEMEEHVERKSDERLPKQV